MISKYVTYKVKLEEVDMVLAAVKTFVAAIADNEPETKYTAYQAADRVNFMHTMQFMSGEAEEKHRSAHYTLTFVDVVYPRCEIAPEFTDITEIANTGD